VFLHNYYLTPGARATAQGVRCGHEEAVWAMAHALAANARAGDVIVPMPGRNGYAEGMLRVSNAIADLTGARVVDLLSGHRRDSLYEVKKQGGAGSLHGIELGFRARFGRGQVLLVDSVVDTGTTARAALRALVDAGYEPRLLAFAAVLDSASGQQSRRPTPRR
jgi:hypothetical protein